MLGVGKIPKTRNAYWVVGKCPKPLPLAQTP